MIKNIILTAAALSILSTGAISKERSTHCNALDAGPTYGKVELSEKDKCWLDHWKSDETGGVLGSIFWVKVNGEYISMPTKDLTKAGSKSAAKKVVVNTVIEELIVDRIVEVTVENGETIDRLRGEISTLEGVIAGEAGRIEAVAGPLRAQITAKTNEITRLLGLPTPYANGYTDDDVASVNITSDNLAVHNAAFTAGEGSARQDLIDDINSELGTSATTIGEALAAVSAVNNGHNSTITQRTATNIFDVVGGDLAGTYYNADYVADTLRANTNSLINKIVARGAIASAFGISVSDVVLQPTTDGTLYNYLTQAIRAQVAALPTPTRTEAGMPITGSGAAGEVTDPDILSYAANHDDAETRNFDDSSRARAVNNITDAIGTRAHQNGGREAYGYIDGVYFEGVGRTSCKY